MPSLQSYQIQTNQFITTAPFVIKWRYIFAWISGNVRPKIKATFHFQQVINQAIQLAPIIFFTVAAIIASISALCSCLGVLSFLINSACR